MTEYNKEKLFKYAIWLLSKRDYSRNEILLKIKSKNSSEEDINFIINKIVDLGYINDERRARIIYEQYKYKYGWLKIKNKLITKGIDMELIDKIKLEVEEDSDIGYALLLKKFKTYDKSEEMNIWKYLMSKGFEHKQIKNSLRLFKEGS